MLPLLKDSAHISEFEAKFIGKGVEPLYTEQDVLNVMDMVETCPMDSDIVVDSNLTVRFLQNPHIVGATQILMTFKNNVKNVKILWTGDIGNLKFKKPYVKSMEYCKQANLIVTESTYGRNNKTITKKNREEDIKTIKDIIKETVINKEKKKVLANRRILIPIFSQDRLQVMLTLLYDLYKDDETFTRDIIVDSALGLQINKVYKKILEYDDLEKFCEVVAWDKIKYITSGDESKACASDDSKNVIILSSSGFGDAGRITNHLKNILPCEEDLILFVGYSSAQSTSGKIRDKSTVKLKIGNNVVFKKCKIRELTSFSSHIQQDDIVDMLINKTSCDQVLLVHGDKECKNDLRDKLQEEFSKVGKTTKVLYGERDMVIYL